MTGPRQAVVLLLAGSTASGACPPGIEPVAFARALAEDVADLMTELDNVDPVLVAEPHRVAEAEAIRWPGSPVLEVPPRRDPAAGLAAALDVLAEAGYPAVALLPPDVPDLPGLVVAKSITALDRAEVAVAPAVGGGLAALATRLPPPPWLGGSGTHLDDTDAVRRLAAVAPGGSALAVTPGWHRLRTPADLGRLDPALEGWDATRALLSGR